MNGFHLTLIQSNISKPAETLVNRELNILLSIARREPFLKYKKDASSLTNTVDAVDGLLQWTASTLRCSG